MRASWQANVLSFLVRRRVKPRLGDMSDLARVRKVFDSALPVPKGVRYIPDTLGGVPGEWVEALQPAMSGASSTSSSSSTSSMVPTTLLYLHGGGFVGCSPKTHRPITAGFALRGLRVFVPDYRLAPEHPFPAATLDVQAVYRALRLQTPGARLVVAGDSAGGNLALGLMQALRDAGETLPQAAVLFSPGLDLAGASPSIMLNADSDAMFHGPHLQNLANHYLQGADASLPLASPLLADMAGLPPLLIHVGASETLRDDGLRLAQKARQAGVTVELRIFKGVPHVWQQVPWVPEARQSMAAAARFLHEASTRTGPEEIDVVIIGAGLSGIGAAVHLMRDCPGKSFTLLESRAALGGTWDLFRYPGVRSDSDMYTLGYEFKPWKDARAIADGPSILRYVQEAADENGVGPMIRYRHRVLAADWSASQACWTLSVAQQERTEPLLLRARFLLFCSGYYSYTQAYRPPFPGEERYTGTLVHPQFWPAGLDHAGKRVVVIGSGATAVTLVPEMAKTAAHVTLLQRSPSYMLALPRRDAMAQLLKKLLPARLAYTLVRAKNVLLGMSIFGLLRRYPERGAAALLRLARRALGPQFDLARHFTPSYRPWDQRLCLLPDGDLFKSLRQGRASVLTEQIASFTETGIRLASGQELAADIVVTATGLQINVMGDVKLSLDGRPVDLSQGLVYKGLMHSGLPNLAGITGYTNASWTLKADLSARYVCRLLQHMDRHGYTACTPLRDPAQIPEPVLNFSSGYVQRALHLLPQQGHSKPWRLDQNYLKDVMTLRWGRIADGVLSFAPGKPG